jgi:hypothetical protein
MSWLVLNSYGWSVFSVFLFSSIRICAYIRDKGEYARCRGQISVNTWEKIEKMITRPSIGIQYKPRY